MQALGQGRENRLCKGVAKLDIYPNYPAPVVRNAPDGTRELT